jgi:hypothetical protein
LIIKSHCLRRPCLVPREFLNGKFKKAKFWCIAGLIGVLDCCQERLLFSNLSLRAFDAIAKQSAAIIATSCGEVRPTR